MNADAWRMVASYYKKCVIRDYGRDCNQRLLYADNYGVHSKYQEDFENVSGHNVRYLIKNCTSKQQPIDHDIGVFIQNFVHKAFWKMEREYTELLRKTGEQPPKMDLPSAQIFMMNTLAKCTEELRKNRERLLHHAWKGSGITIAIDGSEDDDFIFDIMNE